MLAGEGAIFAGSQLPLKFVRVSTLLGVLVKTLPPVSFISPAPALSKVDRKILSPQNTKAYVFTPKTSEDSLLSAKKALQIWSSEAS